MSNARWSEQLDEAEAGQVRALLHAAREADGRPEEIEPPSGGLHLLRHEDGELVGYTHLDTAGDSFGRQVAELIVRPDHRRRGHGTELTRALLARDGDLRIWAHGDHPGAARIAAKLGLQRARELLVLSADVDGQEWPEPKLADGVSLRTFEPGRDEEAVIAVNARAFDWHPEQGALTVDELRATEREPWFDADGFFLAERDGAEGTVIGFHWTKVHPPNPARFGGEPVGEVYVVGVDPGAQGGGLGKALTLAGLRYLRERGLKQVILYVEGDNAPAVAVYTKLGFGRHEADIQYSR
ncbi:mycothiol synthase [Amycolatopsis albispora]|uniref:Mycothiol acetyltransferase n=1 Tax=Amycolatopsis albispora TaxID=1804986 RepID=A0A344LEP9_9PSEU|nr:mycothiol synthase [Amycolatopsis albispora]AXB46523.1 mycothiol synthase [Amycolatopsis albispora]